MRINGASMVTIVSGVLLFVCATPVRATTFAIEPITFFSDATASITATGTITTADNSSVITDWNLKVTTSSRFAQYSPANTANLSINVSSDGQHLTVPTSPDGMLDGGSLYFRSPNPFMDVGVGVADFSQNFGIDGGQAFILAAGLELLPLNQPNGIDYVAAEVSPTDANLFELTPLVFPSGVTVSGTIRTDGTTGLLSPANILAWDIFGDSLSDDIFDPSNSVVLQNQVELSSDGTQLTTVNPDGFLTFSRGAIGGHLYALQLADFSSQSPDGGQAGYLQGRTAVTTIDLSAGPGPWIVATAVPEPTTFALFAVGVISLLLRSTYCKTLR